MTAGDERFDWKRLARRAGAEVIPWSVAGNGRFVLPRADFVPAYLQTHREGRLADKVGEALDALRVCTLCPRDCEVDRLANRFAVCKTGRYARVSAAFPHFGEEDVLRGVRGSGTIFFSWCNLRCRGCQNWQTSQDGQGEDISPRDLARLMLDLQARGCHNINFVTPEHVVPQILEALPHAIEGGLHVPLVYNTSAYDSLHSIHLMDGVIDIYMPDFKLWDRERCRSYLLAPDYPEVARCAIQAMREQVGDLRVDDRGLALRGVLVRHLVMPGMLEDTRAIVGWLADLSGDTYLNVMGQYRPAGKTAGAAGDLGRRVTDAEIRQALAFAAEAGLWRVDERWRRTLDAIRD